ncbi:MAG: hypothetical protein IPK19_40975 [Chloroflexi bacterium]|nr:hypothetical protein [Chloroflexota bacterium]
MSRSPDFDALRDSIFALYHQGEFAEALSLVERESPVLKLPPQAATSVYWRACFLALLGRPDDALAALQSGLRQGYWWPDRLLRGDSDLAPLQGMPAFEDVIAACERLRVAAPEAKPQRLVAEPPSRPGSTYPLVLALHPYNGTAADTLPHWQPLTDRGWLVAALQSSQRSGMDAYHWVDEDRARREVQDHLRALTEAYPIDRSRLVIGGFSNGGRTALLLSLTGAIAAGQVISVGSGLREESLAALDWAALQVGPRPRLLMIAGERDEPVRTHMTGQARTFADHGLDVTLQVVPGLGHQVPADLIARLDAWLT